LEIIPLLLKNLENDISEKLVILENIADLRMKDNLISCIIGKTIPFIDNYIHDVEIEPFECLCNIYLKISENNEYGCKQLIDKIVPIFFKSAGSNASKRILICMFDFLICLISFGKANTNYKIGKLVDYGIIKITMNLLKLQNDRLMFNFDIIEKLCRVISEIIKNGNIRSLKGKKNYYHSILKKHQVKESLLELYNKKEIMNSCNKRVIKDILTSLLNLEEKIENKKKLSAYLTELENIVNEENENNKEDENENKEDENEEDEIEDEENEDGEEDENEDEENEIDY
jgi:hypothetical protein